MELFDSLGFRWDRSAVPAVVPTHSRERVCFRFHRMLPEFVWDAGVLEGNPFTFSEVKTLLDGVTIGGRKISDQEQILNLAESSKRLLNLVKTAQFRLSKTTFTTLHAIVARNEALEWGIFRGEGRETGYTPDVGLGEHGRYTPPPTLPGAPELNRVFQEGVAALAVPAAREGTGFLPVRSIAAILFRRQQAHVALDDEWRPHEQRHRRHQRTGRQGAGVQRKMVRFYLSTDATEMMAFVADCHPEAVVIRAPNPG